MEAMTQHTHTHTYLCTKCTNILPLQGGLFSSKKTCLHIIFFNQVKLLHRANENHKNRPALRKKLSGIISTNSVNVIVRMGLYMCELGPDFCLANDQQFRIIHTMYVEHVCRTIAILTNGGGRER